MRDAEYPVIFTTDAGEREVRRVLEQRGWMPRQRST